MLLELMDSQGVGLSDELLTVKHLFSYVDNRNKLNLERGIELTVLASNNSKIQSALEQLSVYPFLKEIMYEVYVSRKLFSQQVRYVFQQLSDTISLITNPPNFKSTLPLPQPPFLPPSVRPYTLVLDLDQTLVHYKQSQQGQGQFLVRPFAQIFLKEMSKLYEIVIFTAAVKQYADWILNVIDTQGWISYRLYREHTKFQNFVNIKDLSLIGRDLAKTIIVDNIAANFQLQPSNGIFIQTWVGDPADTALAELNPLLRSIVQENSQDVRQSLRRLSEQLEEEMKQQI